MSGVELVVRLRVAEAGDFPRGVVEALRSSQLLDTEGLTVRICQPVLAAENEDWELRILARTWQLAGLAFDNAHSSVGGATSLLQQLTALGATLLTEGAPLFRTWDVSSKTAPDPPDGDHETDTSA